MDATELTGVVADHVAGVNALDTDAIMATFAADAYVNDARREFVGSDAIRRWVEKEMVGDKVQIEPHIPFTSAMHVEERWTQTGPDEIQRMPARSSSN